ncbi:T9SS type A sorting domain-containing protein [candidate division WOR-3 bacterium]|nr:T9SS type A sorting domain-containing protein [candidate division WOR-3 bacterium]MCK4527486.1 T9SS type A sorting domain-containing protein [candidate division WOR-3 bacterium]
MKLTKRLLLVILGMVMILPLLGITGAVKVTVGGNSAYVGVWMWKCTSFSTSCIADWVGMYSNPEIWEPINVFWLDAGATSTDAAASRAIMSISPTFKDRSWHSDGYYGWFDWSWYGQEYGPYGYGTFSDGSAIFANNHGRIFGGHSPGGGWWYTTGAFSRETGTFHRFTSFNQARTAVKNAMGGGFSYLGSYYFYNKENTSSYTTKDHDGYCYFFYKGTAKESPEVKFTGRREIALTTEEEKKLDNEFKILHCSPNPFTDNTHIKFAVKETDKVSVRIYNLTGACVTTLEDSKLVPGYYSLRWEGTDANGEKLPSGVYLCKVSIGDKAETTKIQFVR